MCENFLLSENFHTCPDLLSLSTFEESRFLGSQTIRKLGSTHKNIKGTNSNVKNETKIKKVMRAASNLLTHGPGTEWNKAVAIIGGA